MMRGQHYARAARFLRIAALFDWPLGHNAVAGSLPNGLPPRPPSFGLATPNGRGATNGPIDGVGTPRESAR